MERCNVKNLDRWNIYHKIIGFSYSIFFFILGFNFNLIFYSLFFISIILIIKDSFIRECISNCKEQYVKCCTNKLPITILVIVLGYFINIVLIISIVYLSIIHSNTTWISIIIFFIFLNILYYIIVFFLFSFDNSFKKRRELAMKNFHSGNFRDFMNNNLSINRNNEVLGNFFFEVSYIIIRYLVIGIILSIITIFMF